MAKIHQKSDPQTGGFKIIMELSPMFVGELGRGFDLNDDFPVTDKIGLIHLLQRSPLVAQIQERVRLK